MQPRNRQRDLYKREEKLQSLLEEISQAKEINRENATVLLEYDKSMRRDDLSVSRREKVTRTLFIIAKWINKPFKACKKDDIEKVIDEIESRDFSEWTKHDYKAILKKFYKWLRNSETYPKEVSWIKVKWLNNNHKLPEDLLTEEEVKQLIEHTYQSRDKAFIAVLYESGCRIGELLSMRIKSLQFDEYGAQLVVNGKTGARRVRVIFSTPYLAQWRNSHPSKSDPNAWLWINTGNVNRGEPLDYPSVRQMLKRVALRAGVRKAVNPHNFRHSRATHLAQDLPEATLNEVFGWVQGSRIPQIYVHMSGRDVDKALLKRAGIDIEKVEKEKDNPLKPKRCPRCGQITAEKFCGNCGMVLDMKTAIELKEEMSSIDQKIAQVLRDKEVRSLLLEKLKKQSIQ
jgi:site-specific recombinase XerD